VLDLEISPCGTTRLDLTVHVGHSDCHVRTLGGSFLTELAWMPKCTVSVRNAMKSGYSGPWLDDDLLRSARTPSIEA
jgi:hypothetical protein